MVGAIYGSTRKEPTVVGKPAEFMLENIAKTFSLKRDQICMARLPRVLRCPPACRPPAPAALLQRAGRRGERRASAGSGGICPHPPRAVPLAHAAASCSSPLIFMTQSS